MAVLPSVSAATRAGRWGATTILDVTIRNEGPAAVEGRVGVDLPEGAALTRFALDVGGILREATAAEPERARSCYEEALTHASWGARPAPDPALGEWLGPRRLEVRVFPVPPRGARRVVFAYADRTPRGASVAPPRRSLVVLETAQDYIRFGIAPPRDLEEAYWRIAGALGLHPPGGRRIAAPAVDPGAARAYN